MTQPAEVLTARAAPPRRSVSGPLHGGMRWVLAQPPDPDVVDVLERELQLPRDLCILLAIRGYANPDVAKAYLRPRLERLHDGDSMLGMRDAVARLERAIRQQERILIHGDYDVDGICSTTLLLTVLTELGADAVPFIPHRLEDGYDLGRAGVAAAQQHGATVVLTCDCGTSAVEAVAALNDAGIDVIVTDHHLPAASAETARCLALLNPRQASCAYPDKDLAGVGVAFKLAVQLARVMGLDERRVHRLLDLVALATVADIAPLRGENRILARVGLRMLRETTNPGLRALLRSSGLANKAITAGRVGFVLAPRLNAVGRLGRAMRGVELLLAESEHVANSIARELEEVNMRRQEIDRRTLEQAREMIMQLPLDETFGIVLAHEEWHPGVVGIVASRVVEETGRPAVLVAISDGQGKGSGRSIPAFDLHGGLHECADLLQRYGGHRSAAGVTLAAEHVGEFAARFNAVVRSRVPREALRPELRIDMELDIGHDLDRLEKLLRHLEPFGQGNPGPVFLAAGVRVRRAPRRLGDSGIRFSVEPAGGGAELELLGWNLVDRSDEIVVGQRMDVVFRLERDEWNGQSRLQGKVVDIRGA